MRTGGFPTVALGLLERRWHKRQNEAQSSAVPGSLPNMLRADSLDRAEIENFGEVLRPEWNDPLTGILGNAQRLPLEIRRSGEAAYRRTRQSALKRQARWPFACANRPAVSAKNGIRSSPPRPTPAQEKKWYSQRSRNDPRSSCDSRVIDLGSQAANSCRLSPHGRNFALHLSQRSALFNPWHSC